jgi:hypothetical protein
MWLFTKYGFYSAVCARKGNGEHCQPVDPNRIMVRARLRIHLEALRKRFPDLLDGCDIRDFGGSDYPYRIFMDKPIWSQVLVGLNEEIDYDNFKDKVADFQKQTGATYENSLHEVWSVMRKLQK